MNHWQTREKSLTALSSDLAQHGDVIDSAFALLDDVINHFQRQENESPFIRVCGPTLIKARNYCLGIYGLNLDGLGQEAGALLRVLIESYELLIYFRQDPSRASEVLEERLPRAGEIGKAIEGDFKELRKYLNDNASHMAYSPEAFSHLIDFTESSWRLVQPYNEHALKTNLGVLFGMMSRIIFEGINCLSVANSMQEDELRERAEEFHEAGIGLFSKP